MPNVASVTECLTLLNVSLLCFPFFILLYLLAFFIFEIGFDYAAEVSLYIMVFLLQPTE
jgi:hypothetical protein